MGYNAARKTFDSTVNNDTTERRQSAKKYTKKKNRRSKTNLSCRKRWRKKKRKRARLNPAHLSYTYELERRRKKSASRYISTWISRSFFLLGSRGYRAKKPLFRGRERKRFSNPRHRAFSSVDPHVFLHTPAWPKLKLTLSLSLSFSSLALQVLANPFDFRVNLLPLVYYSLAC